MGRKSGATARTGLDRIAGPRPAPAAAQEQDALWGSTAMPSWLDTEAGRRAWRSRDGADDEPDWSEVLDEESDEVERGDDGPDRDERDHGSGDARSAGSRLRADRSGDDDDWDDDWAEDFRARPRRRLSMLPPAAIGLIGIGVIACVIAGFAVLRKSEPVTPLVAFPASASAGRSSAAPSGPGSSAVEPAGEMVVSVAGLVRRPGLVRLPARARVADAIARAGGAREGADLLSLNMAQLLHDGDQVLIGRPGNGAGAVRSAVVSSASPGGSSGTTGAPGTSGGSGATPAPGGGAKVDLNSATAEQLDALPGVGPVTAQAILAWRQQNGKFSSVDQLAEVDGIGPTRLAKLRDLVVVG
ncbi:MAG: ComEA family DNA-binding protein [Gordonia sp. (in: high G+C Gram-positive bacteria)]